MTPSTSLLPLAFALIIIPSSLAQFFDQSVGLQPPPLPQLQNIGFHPGLSATGLDSTALGATGLGTTGLGTTGLGTTGLGTSALGGTGFGVSAQGPSEAFIQPAKPILAHRAVLRNAADEDRLPSELRNNFYKNPRVAEALAKESWFTPGEEQVVDREAEKIPRDRVVKLLKNAGLARRRR